MSAKYVVEGTTSTKSVSANFKTFNQKATASALWELENNVDKRHYVFYQSVNQVVGCIRRMETSIESSIAVKPLMDRSTMRRGVILKSFP